MKNCLIRLIESGLLAKSSPTVFTEDYLVSKIIITRYNAPSIDEIYEATVFDEYDDYIEELRICLCSYLDENCLGRGDSELRTLSYKYSKEEISHFIKTYACDKNGTVPRRYRSWVIGIEE
jgi:hypothetical protein